MGDLTFRSSLSVKGNPIPFFGERIPNSILCARIATIYLANITSLLSNSKRILLADRVRLGSRSGWNTATGLDKQDTGTEAERGGCGS
jgi:hypothetical protein